MVLPNVGFYKGRRPCSVGFIDHLLAWKGRYDLLEQSHEYIQWLFPNYFASRFNPDAYPLSPEEARNFREDPEIAAKYLESYELFLDFLGLELKDLMSGEIRSAEGGGQRLYNALVLNTHNQLRICRVLASLAVTGPLACNDERI